MAKADFKLTIGALDQFTGTFERFGEQLNASTAGIRRFGNEMQVAGRRISTALGLPKLKKAFEDLNKAGQKVGEGFKSIATRAAGIGLAITGAGAGLFALTKVYADYNDEAAKTAQRAGIAMDAWQEMAYVASLSDVKNEELLGSYQKLNKAMFDAAKGGATQSEAFKNLGITLTNSKGELKATDEVMLEVADALSKMPEGAAKAAAANAIFGESGAKLLPMLNAGKDGIMNTRREAEALGLVMGKDAGAASEAFNDNITRLQSRFKGLGMIVGGALMPSFNQLVTGLSELIDKNRDLIKVKVSEYAEKFAKIIPKILSGVEKVVGYIPKAIGFVEGLFDTFGTGNVVAVGLGATFAGPLFTVFTGFIDMIAPLASILTSVFGGLKMVWTGLGYFSGYAKMAAYALKALTLNPVSIFIMAMVVAFKLIFKYFGGFDAWLQLMDEGITQFGNDIKAAAGWVMDKLGSALEWFLDLVSPITDKVKEFAASFKEFLAPAIDAVMKFIQPLIDKVNELFDLIGLGPEKKTGEQMDEEALQAQRSEMLRKKEAGEISNEAWLAYRDNTNKLRQPGGAAAPKLTPEGAGAGPDAATGGATVPGIAPSPIEAVPGASAPTISAMPGGVQVQKTEHTEIKEEKVNMTLTLPPGVTMTPTTGTVPANVKVSSRAGALGVAGAG
jgi:hypothetical protein